MPIQKDAIRTRKNKNCKLVEVKQIRIHDFRHSCASLLINNGADITLVVKYLGHSKIDEILNAYSHMFRNKLDNIMELIDNLNDNAKIKNRTLQMIKSIMKCVFKNNKRIGIINSSSLIFYAKIFQKCHLNAT